MFHLPESSNNIISQGRTQNTRLRGAVLAAMGESVRGGKLGVRGVPRENLGNCGAGEAF